jgi:hypothetical protein
LNGEPATLTATGDGWIELDLTEGQFELQLESPTEESILAPLLKTPDNRTSGHPSEVSLHWSIIDGTRDYFFEVSESPDFATPVSSGKTRNAYRNVYNLEESKTYYWRVRASSRSNESAWSFPFSFTVGDHSTWPYEKPETSLDGEMVLIRFFGENGKSYQLQQTLNPGFAIWEDYGEPVNGEGRECIIKVPVGAIQGYFFRVVFSG